MSTPPERTIKAITQELYDRFGCAGAPRAKTAKLLEQIGNAVDQLVQERDVKQERLEQMDRFLAYHGHIEEFYEVLSDESAWMYRYINGDVEP